jgi:hypothetical protein
MVTFSGTEESMIGFPEKSTQVNMAPYTYRSLEKETVLLF